METRPNILFLFADDQRFDTIRALGNEHVITPNIDRLVQSGTTFTNAYIPGGTCGAVCMPSRAMLMTGRTLFHIDRQGQDIPAEHATMPRTFADEGYETFATGKWHNGRPAFNRAFDGGDNIFFGGMDFHFKTKINHYDPDGVYPEEQIFIENGSHSTDLFSASAIEFLRNRDGDKPFFLYLPFTAPHDPRETHRKYHDMYDPGTIPMPENFLPEHPFDNGDLWTRDELLAPFPRTPEKVRRHIAEYYAMITHLDDRIGLLIDTLDEIGEADNTIIVFAGDNGLALGRHGLMGKQNIYDHSVHVPLIMSGPGVPEGELRDAYCYLLDIFPTLCDLAGIETPGTVEGKSLAPVLNDPAHVNRETLFFAYINFQRGVQDSKYKLIEYLVDGARTTQLFDRTIDPFELNNLSADPSSSSELKRLRGELQRLRNEWDDPCDAFGSALSDTA